MPITGTQEETKVDHKSTDLIGVAVVGLLLVAAIVVDSLRHPTKSSKVIVHGTHVEVEPLRQAAGRR